ncbi:MAG: ATP-binding protein [Pseudomonadota bacterium]
MCLDLMYGQTRTAWLSNAFCIAMLWLAFWTNADHRWLLGWTIFGILFMGLREFASRRYQHLAGQTVDLIAWTRWLEVSLAVNGCYWGIGCAAFALVATPQQLPVIVLIAGGLQTGSVLSSSYLMRAFALFSVPLLLFPLGAFLWLGAAGERSLLVTAALFLIWSLFILLCAARFSAHYRQSLGYSLENHDLAQSLQGQVAENETLNQSLEARIRELKDTEQQLLREKARSDEAAAAKSSFLATMSHEIRTPMNGVLGMAQLLATDRLDDEQRAYVQTIISSGESLLTILNDVLDLSKIESGKLTLDPQPSDLQQLVQDVGQLMGSTPGADGLQFSVSYDPALPQWFLVDDTRLRQVLINLIGNALKFTDEGRVQVTVTGEPMSDRWALQIRVRDSGVGIPADKLDHIFDQFTQAESSTTRRYGGTGLGLSISNSLVVAMGGRIEVSSVFGEGSCFAVHLPLPVAEAPIASSATGAGAIGDVATLASRSLYQGRRILVADDNPVNRVVACKMLERLGLQVEQVANGQEALDATARTGFDLVLMDVSMPVMDGSAATAAVREREQRSGTDRLPIVALTAHAIAGDSDRFLQQGFDAYLAKPIDQSRLQRVISDWLSGPPGQPEP